MPTKRGKSVKVFRAEQAAKAVHRQQLYTSAGLSSSSESVFSELVPPVQLPPGSKSLKSAQQTMATWLSPQATTPLESPHLKRGSGNKRVQVSSPDLLSSVHISRGSWGSKPSNSVGDAISMGDEGINSPPWTTSSSKSGQPLAARLSTAVPPPPSVPANMSPMNAASPHRPTQLSCAQALASPGRRPMRPGRNSRRQGPHLRRWQTPTTVHPAAGRPSTVMQMRHGCSQAQMRTLQYPVITSR